MYNRNFHGTPTKCLQSIGKEMVPWMNDPNSPPKVQTSLCTHLKKDCVKQAYVSVVVIIQSSYLFAGFLIYVFYGLKNSEEEKLSKEKKASRLHTHQDGSAHESKRESVQAKCSYKSSSSPPDIPQNTKL
jgi:hypothetical protein